MHGTHAVIDDDERQADRQCVDAARLILGYAPLYEPQGGTYAGWVERIEFHGAEVGRVMRGVGGDGRR